MWAGLQGGSRWAFVTFGLSLFQMKEMMERAGNSHLLTVLSYPGTGHLIEPPYTPHFRFSAFKTVLTEQLSESRAEGGGGRSWGRSWWEGLGEGLVGGV